MRWSFSCFFSSFVARWEEEDVPRAQCLPSVSRKEQASGRVGRRRPRAAAAMDAGSRGPVHMTGNAGHQQSEADGTQVDEQERAVIRRPVRVCKSQAARPWKVRESGREKKETRYSPADPTSIRGKQDEP